MSIRRAILWWKWKIKKQNFGKVQKMVHCFTYSLVELGMQWHPQTVSLISLCTCNKKESFVHATRIVKYLSFYVLVWFRLYYPHSHSANTDTKATSFLLSNSFFYYERLKGVWQASSFSIIQFPRAPFQLFLRKFEEIFANEYLLTVLTWPQNVQVNFFLHIL